MFKKVIKTATFFLVVFLALTSLSFIKMADDQKIEQSEFLALSIGGAKINAEVADKNQKRMSGLSNRETLGQNDGMLFVFPVSATLSFWMKDMHFPIDIIWLNENKIIVDITKHALPASYPETFSPQKPAQYVLEVNAGFADLNNIKVGDTAEF